MVDFRKYCTTKKGDTLKGHSERAHSKFSASGAERWVNCPGSVELSEGRPDKSTPWAVEGTAAHEILERIMLAWIELVAIEGAGPMWTHGYHAAQFIIDLAAKTKDADVMVETRIHLDFIHPEMFGTFDGAVVDHFGTLHVFDYKYGAGHGVSPVENLQMIFYGMGLAHKFNWNFKNVRLWIIQPRIKGYDGPLFWDIPIFELKKYVEFFKIAVRRVEELPDSFVEGSWCYFCKAKSICPLKQEMKVENARSVFSIAPLKISKNRK